MTGAPSDWPHGDDYAHLWARVPRDEAWSGITVRAGWAKVVLETDAALARLDPNYLIYQVKEKYGGLRYYTSFGEIEDHPEARTIIRDAERRVEHICEVCGVERDDVVTAETSPGSKWLATLCRRCRAT